MSLLLALAIRGLPSPHGDDTHAAAKDYMGIMEGSGQTLPQDPKPSHFVCRSILLSGSLFVDVWCPVTVI